MFGDYINRNFAEEGIDTAFVSRDDERPSGVASILVDDDGRNVIAVAPGANAGLTAGDVSAAREPIAGADVVVCQLEIPLEATVEALRLARDARGPVMILNPAPGQRLTNDLIGLCDVIAPNEIEAEVLTGIRIRTVDDAEAAARSLITAGATAAIITLGERGVMMADREGAAHVPAVPVEAVDTTGAGDAFVGTLAYFRGRGEPLPRSVRLANAAAALSVTKVGAQSALPSRAAFDAFVGALKPPP